MATHSSVLAWRIPEMGEPGALPSVGLHRVRHDWSDLATAAAAVQIHTNFILTGIHSRGVSSFCGHLLLLTWECVWNRKEHFKYVLAYLNIYYHHGFLAYQEIINDVCNIYSTIQKHMSGLNWNSDFVIRQLNNKHKIEKLQAK